MKDRIRNNQTVELKQEAPELKGCQLEQVAGGAAQSAAHQMKNRRLADAEIDPDENDTQQSQNEGGGNVGYF